MPNTLNLSIATYNLDISVFSAQGGYDRRLIDTGETEYSIYGTPLDSGTFYDPKHIWTISPRRSIKPSKQYLATTTNIVAANRTIESLCAIALNNIPNQLQLHPVVSFLEGW
jgi:hypothetical protein